MVNFTEYDIYNMHSTLSVLPGWYINDSRTTSRSGLRMQPMQLQQPESGQPPLAVTQARTLLLLGVDWRSRLVVICWRRLHASQLASNAAVCHTVYRIQELKHHTVIPRQSSHR